jgi:hypothetical protein
MGFNTRIGIAVDYLVGLLRLVNISAKWVEKWLKGKQQTGEDQCLFCEYGRHGYKDCFHIVSGRRPETWKPRYSTQDADNANDNDAAIIIESARQNGIRF